MRRKSINIQAPEEKDELRAMGAAGKRIFKAASAVNDAAAALSAVLRKEAETWHGDDFNRKIRELKHLNTNITLNGGRIKFIAGSMTGAKPARRPD